MDKIRILDCTQRNGGYINNWDFGNRTIRRIISRLCEAGTDLIEIGFLRNCTYDPDRTLFNCVQEAKQVLPKEKGRSRFVLMALHDQYDIEKLEVCDGTVEAVRVTFHDYDIDKGLAFCRQVKERGYQLFINPINIMGYSDEMLLLLFKKVNEIRPYGFSIVDTFGSMTKAELVRIYSLCENNLDRDIVLGLHLHENMALSFSLAQSFLEMRLHARHCVLDASLNGMGRVPGNLCIELIADYLNKNYGKAYDIDYILDAIEEHILPIKEKESWGYTTEYFLSAKYNLHRNYAEYLQAKGNLTTKAMNHILQKIAEEKKTAFDPDYIETLYREHENQKVSDEEAMRVLTEQFEGRCTVVLAPGKSLSENWDKVSRYIKEHNAVPVSVNFQFDEQKSGYAFFSNSKRFEEYKHARRDEIPVIVTSNITEGIRPEDYVVNYDRLCASDNAGIMLLHLLQACKAAQAALAGFDGYADETGNYMEGYFGELHGAKKGDNAKIALELAALGERMPLKFLTPSRYEEETH